MYHYMHLLKMTPEQALSAAEINYQQGKKGAFELKDLAEVMPRLIPLGQEYMSNKQVATDLVALLQCCASRPVRRRRPKPAPAMR